MDRSGKKPKSIPPKTKRTKKESRKIGAVTKVTKFVNRINKETRTVTGIIGVAVVVVLFAMVGSVHMLGMHHTLPSNLNGNANALQTVASNNINAYTPSTAFTTTSTQSTTSVVATMAQVQSTTCTFLYNMTSPNSFEVNASGQNYLSGVINYVTPDYAGLTINDNLYLMYPNKTYSVNNTLDAFEVSLINLSYIPVEHSISLQFCSATPLQNLTAAGPPAGFEGGGAGSTPTAAPRSGGGGGGGGGGSSGGGGGGGGGGPTTSVTISTSTPTTTSHSTVSTTSYTTTVSSGGTFGAGTTVQVLYPTVLWGSPSTQDYVSTVPVGTIGTVISSQYNSSLNLLFYEVNFNGGQTGWVKSTQLGTSNSGGSGGGGSGGGSSSDPIATGNPVYDAYDSLIIRYAQEYGISDPMLIKAETMQESSFNTNAYNPSNDCNIKNWIESEDGSFSLLQIARSCRDTYATNADGSFNQAEAFNASYNLNYSLALWLAQETSPPGTSTAVLYLRALAAWNNGPHVYSNTTGVYDPKGYVAAVLSKYQMLAGLAHYTAPLPYNFSTP